jgi:hypothetical protein
MNASALASTIAACAANSMLVATDASSKTQFCRE